jgi:hypothetical protein
MFAIVGFGLGFGLLFQLSPHGVWFAVNAPGACLFSPFVNPGVSVWMIPRGNDLACALMAVLSICASGLAQGPRKTRFDFHPFRF